MSSSLRIPHLALALLLGCFVAVPLQARERGLTLVPTDKPKGEQRLALVIGNADYERAPLKNPVNDAADMAKALQAVGFTVLQRTDVDQETMENSIREFGKRLANGGVGLFYYAGHGVQMDGRNYLIPVNAPQLHQANVKFKAVDLGLLLEELRLAGNRLNITILDACRDNPFRGFRGGTRGLAKTDAPRGTIVAYSTAPGSVAIDGDGRNGLYTKHLLKALRNPGIPIEQVFKRVRIAVVDETEAVQIPWESSSLTGEFFFVKPPVVPPPPQVAALQPPGPDRPFQTQDLVEQAQKAWDRKQERMAEAHKDAMAYERGSAPAALKAELWRRFLKAFPDDHPDSTADNDMRKQAASRVEHWAASAKKETLGKDFDVTDLLSQAEEARQQRISWMRESYEEVTEYDKSSAPNSLKYRAWLSFLESFPEEPETKDDDKMQQQARIRLGYWEERQDERPQTRPNWKPPTYSTAGATTGPEDALARKALDAYRASYQSKDLEGLAKVWLMNPDQREAASALFACAEQVTLEVREKDLVATGGGVYIHFEQTLDFKGPRCMARSSAEPVEMTATLIKGSEGWMISSILPRMRR